MVAGQNENMIEQVEESTNSSGGKLRGGKLRGGKMNSRGGSSFLGELIVPGGLLFLNQMSKRRKSGKSGKKVKGRKSKKSKKARGRGKTRGK